MNFRESRTPLRQVYHAECVGLARDLAPTSIKCGVIYKRGGGWSGGLLSREWTQRFVSFRLVPIVFYFDGETDKEAHNLFVIQDDARVEVVGECGT